MVQVIVCKRNEKKFTIDSIKDSTGHTTGATLRDNRLDGSPGGGEHVPITARIEQEIYTCRHRQHFVRVPTVHCSLERERNTEWNSLAAR